MKKSEKVKKKQHQLRLISLTTTDIRIKIGHTVEKPQLTLILI